MSEDKKLIPKRRFKEFENAGAWEQRKLGEIAQIKTGSSDVKDAENDGKYPFFVRSDKVERSNKYIYNGEAILLPGEGRLGEIFHYINGKFNYHQRVYKISEFHNEIYGKFILYLMQANFKKHALKYTVKATVDSLRLPMLTEYMIYVPELKEQIKIANALIFLDNQITLHQRKLEKLKADKKAYLSEMFPAEGECKPKLRFEGFNDDWEQWKLGEVGYTYTGLSGKTKKDFGFGDAKYVTYLNVFNNTIAKKNQLDSIAIDKSQNSIKYGDVFFTTSSETPDEVGMSSIWLYNFDNIYLNSFCFGFRPTITIDPYFLAYSLRSYYIRKQFNLLAQGISRYNISKTKAMDIFISLPEIKEQKKIGNHFKMLDNQITLHQRRLEKLKNIKKAYLNEMFI